MTRSIAIALLGLSMACAAASNLMAEICQWTDENGVTHFDDSLDRVPEKYRAQCKTSARPVAPAPKQAAKETAQPPLQAPSVQPAKNELKTFEIPYQNEGTTKRVIIQVTFNDAVTVPMALDTGAPGLVMFVDLAKRLRLFSQGKGNLVVASGGIGGSAPAVLTITDSVSISSTRATFVPTTVVERVSPAFEGLVGMDVLAGYTVSIDAKRQVVVFKEDPPDSNARGGHDEAWWRNTFKEFRETRDRWTEYARSFGPDDVGGRKTHAQFQQREAEQLLLKLHQHASDVAVPQEWR